MARKAAAAGGMELREGEARKPVPPPPAPAPEKAVSPAASSPLQERVERLRPILDRLFGIDLRALAVLRIGMAALILIDLVGRAMDLSAFYTDAGVTPRTAVYLFDGDHWANTSPYMWWDGPIWAGFLLALTAFFALMLLFGYHTRLAAVATWFLVNGIQSRNPLVLHGADMTTRVVLFWMMFTPLAARFSLDGWVAQLRQQGKEPPSRALSCGTAGLLLQIGMLYWFTSLLKTGEEWRRNGTALYYALSIEQYATPFGQWLRQQAFLLKPLTFAAVWMEFLGPTLAFVPYWTSRIRTLLVVVFVGFHLVLLNLCFDLGPFPYVAALIWCVFLPTEAWDFLGRLWSHRCPAAVQSAVARVRAPLLALQSRRVAARIRKGKRVPSFGLGLEAQGAAVFLIVYVLLLNIQTIDYRRLRGVIPEPIEFIARMLRLDQNWGMFAPMPMKDDGWYVMPGHLRDTTDLDVYTLKQPIDWSKPVHIVSLYPSERWRKYLMNLWGQHNTVQRPFYASYVCRHWNELHDVRHHLDHFQLYYMEKDTLPDYAPSVPVKRLLWDSPCPGAPDAPPGLK